MASLELDFEKVYIKSNYGVLGVVNKYLIGFRKLGDPIWMTKYCLNCRNVVISGVSNLLLHF